MFDLSSGVTIWMLCLLSWKLAVVTSQPIGTGSDNKLAGHGRYKRAMPAAIGSLLARAKLLLNNGHYKLFSRPGGYDRAENDFEALGLTDIHRTHLGLSGRVEDRVVLLRYQDTIAGDGSNGVIDIMRLRDGSIHEPSEIARIRYFTNTKTRDKKL